MKEIDERIHATGIVEIKIYDPDTLEVKDVRTITNKVVTTGSQFIARRMIGTADTVISKMSVGTSGTAPDIAQTALLAAIAGGDASGANFTTTVDASPGNAVRYVATFAAGVGTGAIQEAGLFNSADLMLARTTFAVINKSASDAMAITWTITVTVS